VELVRECIVVQGRGMERWISQRLAAHFGIWANPYFLFARKILRRSIEAVLGEPEERSEPFEPAALTWTVAPLLPDLTRKPGFEQIASYLADDQTKTLAIHRPQSLERVTSPKHTRVDSGER
jgi:exodeoxyribonuclease V gamma subunit